MSLALRSRVDDGLSGRNQGEPEFLSAVAEAWENIQPVLDRHPEFLAANILQRMAEPERQIMFRVPWTDDSGAVRVNRGFRVEFNSALGPYKGGLRFHPSVNLSIIKALAFEQGLKNALTGLSLGGAKGGADFQPRGCSDGEVMRFCQSFMAELFRHIGPSTDVPAGDIGVGAREIGFLFGQYKRLVNRFEGSLTGKGLGWGGSQIRPQATGYGLVYFTAEALATRGLSFEGKVVALSGFGNVGFYALEKLNSLGASVVTIADEDGYIHDPDGIRGDKLRFVHDLWFKRRGSVREYAEEYRVLYEPGRPWAVPCDVALPTATQGEIDLADARNLVDAGCLCVAEGANLPCSSDAIRYLREHGVMFAPGKAANAGGVAVSGLEMAQNGSRCQWTREEVDRRLKETMSSIHKLSLEAAEAYGWPGDYAKGADIAAFLKLGNAMMDQGVV